MPKQHSFAELHIKIASIDPPIWRTLHVDEQVTLRQLHHIIQAAFGWKSAHRYQFVAGTRIYTDPDYTEGRPAEPDQEILDDRKIKLTRLLDEHMEFKYHYDFGDDWIHLITCSDAFHLDEKPRMAIVTGGEFACPLEDIGGPPGFISFLHALNEGKADQYHHLLEDIVGNDDEYDPELFDLRAANAALTRMEANGWGKK